MKLFISKSRTTKTIETDVEMNLNISKLDIDQRQELLNELLTSMTDREIADVIDVNDKMISAILVEHSFISDKDVRHMVYLLEDVETDVLKQELQSLITKYNITE